MTRISKIIILFLIPAIIAGFAYWSTTGLDTNSWSAIEIILVKTVAPIVIFCMFIGPLGLFLFGRD